MFAEYAGALAEARRACYALRPDDALRRKIEHELRKIEVAAERGQLCDERIEEALLAKPTLSPTETKNGRGSLAAGRPRETQRRVKPR